MSDDLDRSIREELNRSLGGSTLSPDDVLEGLAPRLTRARRFHHLRMAGTGVAVLVGISVGSIALLSQFPRTSETAVEVTDGSTANAQGSAESGAPTGTSPADSDEESVFGATAPPTTLESSSLAPTSLVSPSSGAGSQTGPSTTTAPIVPSSTAGSDSTSTPTVSGGEQRLATQCGFVTIDITNTEITLISVDPFEGFERDVKNSGPETVEVSFESSRDHCELKAEIRDGELWTDIDDDEHEDDE